MGAHRKGAKCVELDIHRRDAEDAEKSKREKSAGRAAPGLNTSGTGSARAVGSGAHVPCAAGRLGAGGEEPTGLPPQRHSRLCVLGVSAVISLALCISAVNCSLLSLHHSSLPIG